MKSRPAFWFGFVLLFTAVICIGMTPAYGGLSTADFTSGVTASDLVNTLLGGGISPSNVTYTGANVAAGTFAGGTGIIGFESGIILSSGDIANVIGPNVLDNISTVNSTSGDSDLTTLVGTDTFDASVLEFDFVPVSSPLTFSYVFASDEYNEFVNSEFNDVFAFFVNGTNCALVPGTTDPVSINKINNGNPFGDAGSASHPEFYRNNDLQDGGGSIDTEMDGLTTVLTCTAVVNPNQTNHIKLAIADASDTILDSVVFIKAGSFAVPTPTPSPTNTPTPTSPPTDTPTPTGTPTQSPEATASPTDTPTVTPTSTHTATPTPTSSPTQSPEATASPTDTPTVTPTSTHTATPTPTSSPTQSPEITASPTNTATNTPTPTSTNTPKPTPTCGLEDCTPTPTPTKTPTPIPSATPGSECPPGTILGQGHSGHRNAVIAYNPAPGGILKDRPVILMPPGQTTVRFTVINRSGLTEFPHPVEGRVLRPGVSISGVPLPGAQGSPTCSVVTLTDLKKGGNVVQFRLRGPGNRGLDRDSFIFLVP